MLISRLALLLFWFPGVCPLRLEYFHIPQKDYGFLFLFSLFNFQGPVRSVSSVKRLTILPHLSMFVKNFFPEVFSWELFYSITPFSVCQELFSLSFSRNFSILPQPLKVCQDFFPLSPSAWLFYHAFSLLSTPFFIFFRLFPRFVRFVGFLHNLSTSVYTRRTTPAFVHPP